MRPPRAVLQFSAVALWMWTSRSHGLCFSAADISYAQLLTGLALAAFGQQLNVGIFNAIGADGVYYGFKLGVKVSPPGMRCAAHLMPPASTCAAAGTLAEKCPSSRGCPDAWLCALTDWQVGKPAKQVMHMAGEGTGSGKCVSAVHDCAIAACIRTCHAKAACCVMPAQQCRGAHARATPKRVERSTHAHVHVCKCARCAWLGAVCGACRCPGWMGTPSTSCRTRSMLAAS